VAVVQSLRQAALEGLSSALSSSDGGAPLLRHLLLHASPTSSLIGSPEQRLAGVAAAAVAVADGCGVEGGEGSGLRAAGASALLAMLKAAKTAATDAQEGEVEGCIALKSGDCASDPMTEAVLSELTAVARPYLTQPYPSGELITYPLHITVHTVQQAQPPQHARHQQAPHTSGHSVPPHLFLFTAKCGHNPESPFTSETSTTR
jgi:hypothetical protein